MSEDHDADDPGIDTSSVNRRRFVKSLGAIGGAAVAGAAGAIPASAAEVTQRDATQDEVREAVEDEKTQKLLNEIGSPPVQEDAAGFVLVDRESGEITVTTLPTEAGEILYAQGEETVEVSISFGSSFAEEPGSLSLEGGELPAEYQQLPAGSEVLVHVGERGISVIRLPTSSEREQLSQLTGIPEGDLYAIAYSGGSGFQVYDTRQKQPRGVQVIVPGVDRAAYHEVELDNAKIERESLSLQRFR